VRSRVFAAHQYGFGLFLPTPPIPCTEPSPLPPCCSSKLRFLGKFIFTPLCTYLARTPHSFGGWVLADGASELYRFIHLSHLSSWDFLGSKRWLVKLTSSPWEWPSGVSVFYIPRHLRDSRSGIWLTVPQLDFFPLLFCRWSLGCFDFDVKLSLGR